MSPVGEHALVELAPRFANRDRRDDPVEPVVEVIEIRLQSGVLQRLPPPADRYGPQQPPAERRAERRVATLDRIFRVAEQVRQTD
jgi:hypothetical protein